MWTNWSSENILINKLLANCIWREGCWSVRECVGIDDNIWGRFENWSQRKICWNWWKCTNLSQPSFLWFRSRINLKNFHISESLFIEDEFSIIPNIFQIKKMPHSSSKISCLYVDTCKMFGLEINEENYYSFEECSRKR